MKKVWYAVKSVILGVTLGALVISQSAFAQEAETDETGTASETETGSEVTISASETEMEQTMWIEPLGSGLVPGELEDAAVAAEFDSSDIYLDEDGNLVICMDVYDKEIFDMVLISMMDIGDTILLGGEAVIVESLENDGEGSVIINGGWDAKDGHVLCTDESTIYYEVKANGTFVYTLVGEAILGLDETFVFTDDSDPENPGLEYSAEDFLNEELIDLQGMHFSPEDTTVTVEGGLVTGITKIYIEEEASDLEGAVLPLPSGLALDELPGAEYSEFAVGFASADVCLDEEGTSVARVDVYDKELFDLVDVSLLEAGSVIVLGGEAVTIESLENDEDGSVIINGGWDAEGGHVLCTDEDTVYYEVKADGLPVYANVGEVILPLGEEFVFINNADAQNPGIEYSAEDFLNEELIDLQGMQFEPENTIATVENGVLTQVVAG